MELNFKNEDYKKKALESKPYSQVTSNHRLSDAFILLLHGISNKDLSNLCNKLHQDLISKGINLDLEGCYKITQGEIPEHLNLDTQIVNYGSIGDYLLKLAYECLDIDKNHLGENVINETLNTSGWLSHSLYEARVMQKLATFIGVEPEKAGILGLLHDYGRKFTHDFSHVTRGYEALIDAGWKDEARATLTHSFINAGRCANCDPAEEGFYIDEEGKPTWTDDAKKDDITDVLENMHYDEYDTLLNIADLMATDKGITSPFERVQDVATRKTPDVRNRAYFLSEFTNKLIYMIELIQKQKCTLENTNPTMDLSTLDSKFKEVSEKFYNIFRGTQMTMKQLVALSIGDINIGDFNLDILNKDNGVEK